MHPTPPHARPGHRAPLECRRLVPGDAANLFRLFEALVDCGADSLFHPHPFTFRMAEAICGLHENEASDDAVDEYHVAFDPAEPGRFVAYGMLRGWSEGYAIPSLGIAVHPSWQGRGVARRFMAHLHAVAADRGAEQVRLKVYRHNEPARRLYESLGYELSPHSDSELIGFFPCAHRVVSPC